MLGRHQITIDLGGADAYADLYALNGRYESLFATAEGREEMNNHQTKMDRIRRRTLVVLALATAVGSSGLAAGGTAGALLGTEITGTEAAAGLPLGLLVVGSAAAALLISRRTSRAGRGRSLALGYFLGAIGAALVVTAAVASNLVALLVGSTMLGAGNAAIFLTRYAAAEVGHEGGQGRALGVVFFATALGAVVSPFLLGPSGDLALMLGLPSLSGLYLVAVLCFAISAFLLATASSPGVPYFGRGAALLGPRERERVTRRHVAAGLSVRPARTALIILAVTNLVMVEVMAVVPVHMVLYGHALGLVGVIVGVHVAGMFVPSPVSGWAVDRVGSVTVAASGIFLLVGAGVTGALIDQGSAFSMTAFLAVLGIGWKCGVVGGSMLLAASVPTTLRPHVEGLGEVAMGLAAGAGAPVAGMVVAFGGFTTLSLAGATTAMLALVFVWR